MISRPLELADKLRAPPRSMDCLFYVNAGLLVLCFFLFGSRYVLSPGLSVDFRLPVAPGANAEPRQTTHMIDVVNAGQIFAGDGVRDIKQLQEWLDQQARKDPNPSLLIRASAGVPSGIVAQIVGMAKVAGFRFEVIAAEEPSPATPNGQ